MQHSAAAHHFRISVAHRPDRSASSKRDLGPAGLGTVGEWVSSDWPVCPVGDTAAPHKMGAALTYARRYALFTLVGIAGEDDLDAPDLLNGTVPLINLAAHLQIKEADAPRPSHVPSGASGNGRHRKSPSAVAVALLPPDRSATLRDRLLGEVAGLQSAETAASWARDGIIAKNRLAAARWTLASIWCAMPRRPWRRASMTSGASRARPARGVGDRDQSCDQGGRRSSGPAGRCGRPERTGAACGSPTSRSKNCAPSPPVCPVACWLSATS